MAGHELYGGAENEDLQCRIREKKRNTNLLKTVAFNYQTVSRKERSKEQLMLPAIMSASLGAPRLVLKNRDKRSTGCDRHLKNQWLESLHLNCVLSFQLLPSGAAVGH